MEKMMAKIKSIKTGDGFKADSFQGPAVSQLQFDRVMAYIESGKQSGAKVLAGGEREGKEGYFVQPTVFGDVPVDAKINREEIFGPVLVCHRFKDHEELIRVANDSVYGLAAAVFSRDISRALETAHALQAGTVWVNCYNQLNPQVPFGGYKTSGIGREMGEYALANYTQIKAVHVNLNAPAPL
jgi:aldehyde dehydrogenase (NAD+)